MCLNKTNVVCSIKCSFSPGILFIITVFQLVLLYIKCLLEYDAGLHTAASVGLAAAKTLVDVARLLLPSSIFHSRKATQGSLFNCFYPFLTPIALVFGSTTQRQERIICNYRLPGPLISLTLQQETSDDVSLICTSALWHNVKRNQGCAFKRCVCLRVLILSHIDCGVTTRLSPILPKVSKLMLN